MTLRVPHRLTALALVLLLAGWGALSAGAQSPTPTPTASPFQTVRVAGYDYPVDPFFPCASFLIERTTRLDPERGPITTIVMQPFHRDAAGQMVADEAYPTTENDLTATADVGQAFTCAPQVAAGEDTLDG